MQNASKAALQQPTTCSNFLCNRAYQWEIKDIAIIHLHSSIVNSSHCDLMNTGKEQLEFLICLLVHDLVRSSNSTLCSRQLCDSTNYFLQKSLSSVVYLQDFRISLYHSAAFCGFCGPCLTSNAAFHVYPNDSIFVARLAVTVHGLQLCQYRGGTKTTSKTKAPKTCLNEAPNINRNSSFNFG